MTINIVRRCDTICESSTAQQQSQFEAREKSESTVVQSENFVVKTREHHKKLMKKSFFSGVKGERGRTSTPNRPEKNVEIQWIYYLLSSFFMFFSLYTYIMPPFNFVHHRMSVHNTVEIDIAALSNRVRIQGLAQPHLRVGNVYINWKKRSKKRVEFSVKSIFGVLRVKLLGRFSIRSLRDLFIYGAQQNGERERDQQNEKSLPIDFFLIIARESSASLNKMAFH